MPCPTAHQSRQLKTYAKNRVQQAGISCPQVGDFLQETCTHCILMVEGHNSFSLCRDWHPSIHHSNMATLQSIGSRSTSHINRSCRCAMSPLAHFVHAFLCATACQPYYGCRDMLTWLLPSSWHCQLAPPCASWRQCPSLQPPSPCSSQLHNTVTDSDSPDAKLLKGNPACEATQAAADYWGS